MNGKVVTELGTRVHPGRDEVRVDGKAILAEEPVYYAFHKPPKMITSLSDPEGRPCVGDLAREVDERIFPVGRLDWDAEGLLLLTNDGALANRLTHPRYGVPRTYDAKVRGAPSEAVLEALRAGVRLEDGMARPESVERVGRAKKNTWVRVVVAEGRPHLVKRLLEAVGHPVQRLRRVAYGGVHPRAPRAWGAAPPHRRRGPRPRGLRQGGPEVRSGAPEGRPGGQTPGSSGPEGRRGQARRPAGRGEAGRRRVGPAVRWAQAPRRRRPAQAPGQGRFTTLRRLGPWLLVLALAGAAGCHDDLPRSSAIGWPTASSCPSGSAPPGSSGASAPPRPSGSWP